MTNVKKLLSVFLICLFSGPTQAQKAKFVSAIDEDLSIRSVLVLPLLDNTNAIYAGPLTSKLMSLLEADKQWDEVTFTESNERGPEYFEENPQAVRALQKKYSSDAVLSGRISKGPAGMSITLILFSGKEGLPTSKATLNDFKGFELRELEQQTEILLKSLKDQLPYSGMILSRKGQLVTVNLGLQNGYRVGDELNVIQILTVQRHPRFKFITNSNKEILGKIRISKVEEFLSFASIVSEREVGVINTKMKLIPVRFVNYPEIPSDNQGKLQPEINNQSDKELAFGETPKEWIPNRAPTFGRVGLLLGLGTFSNNNTLNSVGAMNSTSGLTPSIHFNSEIWLNPEWMAQFDLHQYVYSLVNPYPNSSPTKLNGQSTELSFQLGYNLLLTQTFFGPKLTFSLGWNQYKSTIDSSVPVALTALTFTGFNLGMSGSLPVSDEMPLIVGGGFNYFLSSSVDESPVTSGSSNKATQVRFKIFADYQYTVRYSLGAALMYDQNQVQFSGVGTRPDVGTSASHNFFTLAAGINYSF
jgi:hypothetical protein